MPETVFIGQKETLKKVFTKTNLEKYFQSVPNSDMSISRTSRIEIVPEALLAGLFSSILGTKLPGEGTIYLKQTLNFLDLAQVEDEIVATVEIINIRPDKGLITCKTLCKGSKNNTICEGEALVMNKNRTSQG